MQVVIDVDDNLYTRLFDNGVNNYDDAVDMAKAIRKGIPLPKGHGRLIDAGALTPKIHGTKSIIAMLEATTIIEADKESEVDK